MGRGRRQQLRRGQQPRARCAFTASSRWRGSDRAQLRPHSRVQPQEAGPAGTDVAESRGLRPHTRGRSHQPRRAEGHGARQARGVPCETRGRNHRDTASRSLVQRASARVDPQGLGAEFVSRRLRASKEAKRGAFQRGGPGEKTGGEEAKQSGFSQGEPGTKTGGEEAKQSGFSQDESGTKTGGSKKAQAAGFQRDARSTKTGGRQAPKAPVVSSLTHTHSSAQEIDSSLSVQ